jgi:hypothetical protein
MTKAWCTSTAGLAAKEEFFFVKKTQKTFAIAPKASRSLRHPCAAPGAKVFASFFKKKRFLASRPPARNFQEG